MDGQKPIFAELPSEFMGYLIAAIVTLLSGAVAFKNLLTKPSEKEAVQRKDFDELRASVANISTQIGSISQKLMDYVTREEMNSFRGELGKQVHRLERYARVRNQKLTDQLNALKLDVEVLHRNLQKEIGSLLDRVNEKVDGLRNAVERRMPRTDGVPDK